MVFVYNVIDSLPALAWLAKIEKDSSIISICCGNKVEITNSYFVAGVWDGDFNKGDFDTCRFSCCTGGKLTDIMGGGKILYSYSSTRIIILNKNSKFSICI